MGIADYGKALDAQIDLIKFYESPIGQAIWSNENGAGELGASLLLKFTTTMRLADPVYVNRDISRFVAQEMPKVPGPIALQEQYLPFRKGFVLFDRPVVERVPESARGFTGQLRGFCWSDLTIQDRTVPAGRRGLILAGIGNAFRPGEPTPADHLNQIISTDYWFYGDKLEIQEKPFYDGTDSLFIREDGTRWTKWLALRADFLRRALLCTFWFMNNRIAVVSEERPDRPLRRRLGREGLEHLSTIRLIKLRAVDYSGQSEPDHPGVNWSHRWWSREHQRVLYRGTPDERTVWISASIKGPKDKPLIIRKDLIGVIR